MSDVKEIMFGLMGACVSNVFTCCCIGTWKWTLIFFLCCPSAFRL